MDERKVEEEAKKIMDDFLKALENIDEAKLEISIDRKEFLREKGKSYTNKDFRKRFFENAPKKDKDFIKAERGKWTL